MKYLITSLMILISFSASYAQENRMPAGLNIGDKAPSFTATDNTGKIFNLYEELKKGDIILLFYRGQWCPYCNKELSMFNDSLSYINSKGASVVAITPETNENIDKTISKTKATFSIISDQGLSIMKDYKVNFTVDDKTINRYKNYGIDFNSNNGENGANLPIPATYLIGKDGIIKYVYFNTDYKKRSSVKEVLDHL